MAIYNEDAKKIIYTRIGDNYKALALDKSHKRRRALVTSGIWALIIGLFLLLIALLRSGVSLWLYILGSLITAAGIALIISGVVLDQKAKRRYHFDSYAYGERHYEEVLAKIKSETYLTHVGLEKTIEIVDELISSKVISSETKGSGPSQSTYITYLLTYHDGATSELTIKSSESFLFSNLSAYDSSSGPNK
ncbi:MAG: hypothetical protein LUC16_01285 [Coprobacillus sp.]|nr:hypothetical protein [Coprobacillus sp.]